jgi:glycogen synthase
MACGAPVVGARVGAIASTIVDGVTGFVVAPFDADALANKLAILARNPALARAFGRAGILRARTTYSWDRVRQQLEYIYLDVVWSARLDRCGISGLQGFDPPTGAQIVDLADVRSSRRVRGT